MTRHTMTHTCASVFAAVSAACCDIASAQAPLAVDPSVKLEITSAAQLDDAAVLVDGRVLVSGSHTRVDVAAVSGLVMLAADGRHVPTFAPNCGTVTTPSTCSGRLAALPDGGFLLAGHQIHIDGVSTGPLARFDAEGRVDPAFRPLSGVALPYSASIARLAVGGNHAWVLFRESYCAVETCLRSLYSVDLATAGVVAASPALDADLFAVDAAGRAYVRRNGELVRIVPDSGLVDTAWNAGLPADRQVMDIVHEAQTARLFVLAGADAEPAAVLRLDPAATIGYEPGWQLGGAQDRSAVASVLAAARGAVLIGTRRTDGSFPGLALVDATSGAVRASTTTPGGTPVLAARPYREDDWLVAPATPDTWTPNPHGSTLVSIDRMLAPTRAFASRLRRHGRVSGFASAPDGTHYMAGVFSRIGELPRVEIARLTADFKLAPEWPADAGLPRYRDAVWQHATVNGEGVPAFVETIPIVAFPGVPMPSLRVSTAAGVPARRYGGVSGLVLGGSDGWFYVAPFSSAAWSLCNLSGRLGRVHANVLLAPPAPGGCVADAAWAVPFSGSIQAMTVGASHVHFAHQPSGAMNEPVIVRRASTESGAMVDPSWQVMIERSVGLRPLVLHLSVGGPWLYIGGVFDRVGKVSTGPLVRVSLATGEFDPGWTPTLPRAPAAIAASADWVYALVPAQPAAGQSFAPMSVYRWPATSASTVAILATNGAAIVDGGHEADRWTRVSVLPDGRAVVVGSFTRVGDYGRDGLAVIGAIDAVFADGLEAR